MASVDYQKIMINQMRKGTIDDPYIDIKENGKVLDGNVLLSEIPDSFYKVRVRESSGSKSYLTESFDGINSSSQYEVDYKGGIVKFHEDRESDRFTFEYKGRGVYYLNVERIFTGQKDGNVQNRLGSLVDSAEFVESALKEQIMNLPLEIDAGEFLVVHDEPEIDGGEF